VCADHTDPNLRERRLGAPGRPPGLLRKIAGLRDLRGCAELVRVTAFCDAGQEACGPRVHDIPDRALLHL